MRVFAERVPYAADSTSAFLRWKKGDVEVVKEIKHSACCPEMAAAWDHGFIGFGEKEGLLNRVEKVCIYDCSAYPEGAVWDDMPISHCPFCGVRIDVEIRG